MSLFNRLVAVFMTAVMVGALMPPLEAKSRKGDKFYAEGKVHEAKKEWDAALECYQKALAEDPADMLYEMGVDRARFQAAQMHVDLGIKIRAQGRLGEALLEFQKATAINPGSVIAGQELHATMDMIARERKRVEETGKESPPEIRALTPYEEARRKENERISRILPIPELKPLDPTPVDWHLSGQKAKKLFEAICKIGGINVLFDPEYTEPANPITIDLQKATVEETLHYAAEITKSYWKVLGPNTIFVFNDNPNKRRDYEELVTKVYYLQNATLPSELQEMTQILRTGCDINRVFPYNSGFALVVRGEADRVELCEKLVRDVDKPKSEVLVDILVMEASTTLSQQIAAAVANTGLNIPLTFTPRSVLQVQNTASTAGTTTTTGTTTGTTTSTTGITNVTPTTTSSSTTGTQIPLNNLGHISSADFATTLPSALLQAALSDSRSKVLQAPQMRAVDNIKAVMNVGERVPVASGSFQPGVGGVGINPLVNTQFNFQDVGVNVEMLARVVEMNEIYLQLKIDVSDIDSYENIGGISQPIIGQRKIQEELRVKEGDVALLGGVIKQQDDITITGIPGLSKIPLLGNLFKGSSTDHDRDDLMIVLIPHIVRRPEYSAENLRSIAVGNQTISLQHAPPPPVDIHVDGQIPEATVNYSPVVPGASGPAPPGGAAGPVLQPVPAPASAPPSNMAVPSSTAPPDSKPPLRMPMPSATAIPGNAPDGGSAASDRAMPPATAPPATAPPATASSATAPQATAAPATKITPRVVFKPGQIDTKVSSTFTVSVMMEGGTDVVTAPMQIRYNPKFLKLNDVTAGDFFAADGQTPVLNKNIQPDEGAATIMLGRPSGAPGVTGPGGVLVKLSFQAVAAGTTPVSISMIAVRDSQGQIVFKGTPDMSINIQ